MASNSIGTIFKLTTFGESHGTHIGGIIDGCPAGVNFDIELIKNDLKKRKTNQSSITSSRNEDDDVQILSGVFQNQTTGHPIGFIIPNKDAQSNDYDNLKNSYRPSHADYTYQQKYDIRDYRGGGRSSARETANWIVGGAIAKMILQQINIQITAFVNKVGNIQVNKKYTELNLNNIYNSPIRCPDEAIAQSMLQLIDTIQQKGDTLGGVILCVAQNVPVGIGEPIFEKLQAQLAHAMLSINTVKGIEFGEGFNITNLKGSEANDEFHILNDRILTKTNNSGGMQGGISNGADIVFKVAFKPVSSIKQTQQTVTMQGEKNTIEINGRHDACVLPRAVPIVEALTAIVLADLYLKNKNSKI